MSNMMDSFETAVDYSKESRVILEEKARILDAIELNLAAVIHTHLNPNKFIENIHDTFKDTSYVNYFNQSKDES